MGVAVPCTAGLSGVPPFGSIAVAIRLRRPPTIPNASAKIQKRTLKTLFVFTLPFFQWVQK